MELLVTFEQVVDAVRRELVDELLADEDLPSAAVALRLGYTEQSTLTRSCRRWSATTPLARRRALLRPA